MMRFARFRFFVPLFVTALLFAGGCQPGWRFLSRPARNQVICVTSGDNILFRLDEDSANGYRWDYTCDDDDVAVVIDHVAPAAAKGARGEQGYAKVTVHVYRGYDGPSTIRFTCSRPSDGRKKDQFTHVLYRRTGDVAIWE